MKRVPHPGLVSVEDLYVHFPLHSAFMKRNAQGTSGERGAPDHFSQ